MKQREQASASIMTISCDLLMALLDEVGRRRALTDHETDLIEAMVLAESGCSEDTVAVNGDKPAS